MRFFDRPNFARVHRQSLLLAFAIAIQTVPVLSQQEKLYDGRTLEEWREAIKDLSPDNPAHRKAVPGLIEILSDQDVPWFTRRQAANTLGRMGKLAPEGVPVLIEFLDVAGTKEHSPRVWAGKALALYGPPAREAAPRLVEILQDGDLPVVERQVAIDALGRIGGAHPRAIPALVETLEWPQPADPKKAADVESIRELAVESIAYIGADAAIAVPVLLRNLSHPGESFRRKTAAALGRIGAPAQLAIPTLIEVLAFDEAPAVRDAAETALSSIGKPALRALTHLLGDEDPELRERAARALGEMKRTASSAVPQLKSLLKDANPLVKFTAAKSLWLIQGRADDSLPVFVETLTSDDRQLRMQAFRVLTSELGNQATPARASLKKLEDYPDAAVRQAVRKALERIPIASEQPSE